MYTDHTESKKQKQFNVVRDSLQYLQGWTDSELWWQTLNRATTPQQSTEPFSARNEPRTVHETNRSVQEAYRTVKEANQNVHDFLKTN